MTSLHWTSQRIWNLIIINYPSNSPTSDNKWCYRWTCDGPVSTDVGSKKETLTLFVIYPPVSISKGFFLICFVVFAWFFLDS